MQIDAFYFLLNDLCAPQLKATLLTFTADQIRLFKSSQLIVLIFIGLHGDVWPHSVWRRNKKKRWRVVAPQIDSMAACLFNAIVFWSHLFRKIDTTFTHHSRSSLAYSVRPTFPHRPNCRRSPQGQTVCRTRISLSLVRVLVRQSLRCPTYSAKGSQSTRPSWMHKWWQLEFPSKTHW